MITELNISFEEITTQIRSALESGMAGFVQAGDLYVKAIDQDPSYGERLKEEFKDVVPGRAWSQLEALGRGLIHPKLILGGVADRQKNTLIKNLPMSLQNRVFNEEKFPLLISGGDVLDVSILSATPDQTRQLCGYGEIRTLVEQKAYVEGQKLEEELKPQELPYYIKAGKIIFRKNTELSRSEIKLLLTQL
jgi:hypothetical protein